MKNISILALVLAVGCAGQAEEDNLEIGTVEEGLEIIPSGHNTVGQMINAIDFSRCTDNQSASTTCRLLRPVQVPEDSVNPNTRPVRFHIGTPTSNWSPHLNFVTNTISTIGANFQAQYTSGIVRQMRIVDPLFEKANIVIRPGTISGTPAAGDDRWEKYVKPSWNQCVDVPMEKTQNGVPVDLPGIAQVCDNLDCLIDRNDLFANFNLASGTTAQQTEFDTRHLSQAIGHCLRLALSIENSSTAERHLEVGRSMNTIELTADQKLTVSLYSNPAVGSWNYVTVRQ